jgi:sterol desaturase/sphingolipid hydroxylase (fatty acid hydroxylase superfamily)
MIELGLFIIGFLSWSFAEYILHRFLGHETNLSRIFKREHFAHHKDNASFASILIKFTTSVGVITTMTIALYFLIGAKFGFIVSIGFTLGYLYYEMVHRYIHEKPKLIPNFLIEHHMSHHKLYPLANYGVTTRLWDRVFKTYKPV